MKCNSMLTSSLSSFVQFSKVYPSNGVAIDPSATPSPSSKVSLSGFTDPPNSTK